MRRIFFVLIFLAAAPLAHAQESKAGKKVDDMNRAAMEDYDLLEFDAAKKLLNDALAVARRNKLEKSAAAARSHLDLGIVYGAGLNDHDNALLEFIAALQIDPNLKLDPAYKSPALQKTFDQARATVTGGPAKPSDDRALKHVPIEEAQGGQAITVTAKVGADLRPTQVTLVFRPAGAEGFLQVAMRSQNGVDYTGTIPESATRGATVHYYIEARGPSGKVLAAAGTAETPNIISVIQPLVAGQGHDEENPLGRHDGETTTVSKVPEGGKRSFWVGLSVGSGAGYVTGETEVSHQEVTCCLAVAPFHVLPEVGYWLSPHLAISAAVRLGFPIGANVAGAATLAPAVIARFSYETGSYSGIVVHGDLGGGFIRHVIKLTATSATAVMGDTDTFATGPLFVGGGIGWNKPLGDLFHFVVDLDVLAGIPIVSEVGGGSRPTKLGFAVNADLSLGVQAAF